MVKLLFLFLPLNFLAQIFYLSPGFQSKASLYFRETNFQHHDFNIRRQNIASSQSFPVGFGMVVGYRFFNSRKIEVGLFQEYNAIRSTTYFFSYDSIYNNHIAQQAVSQSSCYGIKIPIMFTTKEHKFNNLYLSFSSGISYYFQKDYQSDVWVYPTLALDKNRSLEHYFNSYRLGGSFYWIYTSLNAEYRINKKSYITIKLFFDLGNKNVFYQTTQIRITDKNQISSYSNFEGGNGTGFGFQITKTINFYSKKEKLETDTLIHRIK